MKKLLSLMTLFALTGCGGDAADDAGIVVDGAGVEEASTPAAAVTDAQIAAIVVAANQVDIEAGELARTRATDPRVREFADRMIADHTGVNQAASELVTRLGVTPEPNPVSQQLTDGGAATRATLGGQTGAEFDRAYIANEVTYHQTVLDALDQTLIPSAQNAELRGLLEQSRPAFVAHLEHATELNAALSGQ